MSRQQKFAVLMLLSVAPAFALAQTPQPPPSTTEPGGASASQKAMYDQKMKECMKMEHQKNPSMAMEQAKKNCESQLKMPEPPRD